KNTSIVSEEQIIKFLQNAFHILADAFFYDETSNQAGNRNIQQLEFCLKRIFYAAYEGLRNLGALPFVILPGSRWNSQRESTINCVIATEQKRRSEGIEP